jgi:GH18 family chitinase
LRELLRLARNLGRFLKSSSRPPRSSAVGYSQSRGPTRTVFSDIARSEANQKKFIASLKTFLTDYNFDGVESREGYANPITASCSFERALKVGEELGEVFEVLFHFDLENLHKHVDFFNIMSYDLHGKWDLGNQWLDP